MDLVAYDGGYARGDFLWTLTLTDPATGWTELATDRNKSRFHVLAAFETACARLPFAVTEETQNALRQQALTLNPASLARTIHR